MNKLQYWTKIYVESLKDLDCCGTSDIIIAVEGSYQDGIKMIIEKIIEEFGTNLGPDPFIEVYASDLRKFIGSDVKSRPAFVEL